MRSLFRTHVTGNESPLIIMLNLSNESFSVGVFLVFKSEVGNLKHII